MSHTTNYLRTFRHDKRAVSPAISLIIVTAATIVMVLVSSSYAYSALQRQQAISEFQAMQKSFQTFDDFARSVAWNSGSSRTIHFTANFGSLSLVPDALLSINVTVDGLPVEGIPLFENETGYLLYSMPTKYLTFTNNYNATFIGDNSPVTEDPTEKIGQGLIKQESSSVNIYLNYRVRVLQEPPNAGCTYVDIFITRLDMDESSANTGDFNLLVKNTGVSTTSYSCDAQSGLYAINVSLDGAVAETGWVPVDPDSETVVFNFIVTTVQVTV